MKAVSSNCINRHIYDGVYIYSVTMLNFHWATELLCIRMSKAAVNGAMIYDLR